MSALRSVALALAIGLFAGCSSEIPSASGLPDGDQLTFDAAMLARADAAPIADGGIPMPIDAAPRPPDARPLDAGPPDAGPPPCTASTSSDGVLTNHPEGTFRSLGGPLVLRTAHLQVLEGPSTTALLFFGEVENTGTTMQCTPLPDLFVAGRNLYPTFHARPWIQGSSTVSSACVSPGERGVMAGIELGVEPWEIEPLGEVRYAMNGRAPFTTPDGSAQPVLLASEVRSSSDGPVIAGTMLTRAPIRNVRVEVFGRDACGLVWGEWNAFPPDSVTRTVGSFEFVTFDEAIDQDGTPVDWLTFTTFIRVE